MLQSRLAALLNRRLDAHVEAGESGLNALLRAMYRQALLDLSPFVQFGRVQWHKWQDAPIEKRSRALSAAMFLADVLPTRRADDVFQHLLDATPRDEAEELLLSIRFGTVAWQEEIGAVCFRCGRKQTGWRQVFVPPQDLPEAYHWRYGIPENHVPLCRACADHTFPGGDENIRRLWGMAVWGVRFTAWARLHDDFQAGYFPEWDKDVSPLWPTWYGGTTWASGAGEVAYRFPLLWNIRCTRIHRDAARELLRRHSLFPSRRGGSLLWQVAQGRGRR